MRRARSITRQLLVLAASCGLGMGVRHWRAHQTPSAAPAVDSMPPALTEQDEKSPNDPPAKSLVSMTAEELDQAREAIFNPRTSSEDDATRLLELFKGVHTSEDAAILFDLMLRHPSATKRDNNHNHLINAILLWSRIDPAAALQATSRIGYFDVRDDAVEIALRSWLKRDFASAMAHIKSLKSLKSGPVAQNAPRIVGEFLAEKDPAEAMRWILEMNWLHAHDNRMGPVHAVMQRWQRLDRDAAWKFAVDQPGATRRTLLTHLIRASAEENPAQTWQVVSTLDPSTLPQQALQNVIQAWAARDAQQAFEAVLRLPEGDNRAELLRIVGGGRGTAFLKRPPLTEAEAARLVGQISAQNDRDHFLLGLSEQDGHWEQAAHWAQQISEGPERITALKRLGAEWTSSDPVAASEWLARLAPSPSRDAFIGEFVRSLFESDPEAALSWSMAIEDPGKRQRRLNELWPRWHSSASDAATLWLDSASLSESEKSALLRVSK